MNKIILGLLLNLLIYGSVSAQIYMYGTTLEGGTNNLGTIYRVDQNGQNDALCVFHKYHNPSFF